MPCSHYLCERYGWHREEWHKEEEKMDMEILNHNHPRPNCPACEQVGRWQAEETVRRKLEAAEEMAKALENLVRLCPTFATGESGDGNLWQYRAHAIQSGKAAL